MMCEHRLGESAHCIIGTLMLVCLKLERWPEGSCFNGCAALFPPWTRLHQRRHFTAFWEGTFFFVQEQSAILLPSCFQKFRNSLDIHLNKKHKLNMKGHLSLKEALMHDVSFMNYRCPSHRNACIPTSPFGGRRRGPSTRKTSAPVY